MNMRGALLPLALSLGIHAALLASGAPGQQNARPLKIGKAAITLRILPPRPGPNAAHGSGPDRMRYGAFALPSSTAAASVPLARAPAEGVTAARENGDAPHPAAASPGGALASHA
ncbi:MAG: hypothetical protein O6934_00215, partial [SAR324 cluster bacterium]|nr:hypothetical protein [SAR324 cluster bacterium]